MILVESQAYELSREYEIGLEAPWAAAVAKEDREE